MGVNYNGKSLELFKAKTGGKNKGSVDGFYRNTAAYNEQFFIKKPEDKLELFTELFAGLLIQEFIDKGLVAPQYTDSLIKADVIRFEDGSYGLIQPCVQFKELFRLIGTGNAANSDRSAMQEALYGPGHYARLINYEKQFGLSISLMYSLLFGAHSVHSANIVVIDQGEKGKQFARIDWGDAFRNYAHPENNKNILYPYETSGWLNYKKLTKDYFLNYRKIAGLFPAIASKATDLQQSLQPEMLTDMVASALRKIPADLMDNETKNKLAYYTAISDFSDCSFGSNGNVNAVAQAIAAVLDARMNKITQLKDLISESELQQEDMYASIISPSTLTLSTDRQSFTEQLESWQGLLEQDKKCTINPEAIDLSQLTQEFNYYLADLAIQSDALNIWQNTSGTNIFTAFRKEDQGLAMHGHAFIPQYKESTIFLRLFSLNSLQATARFAAFEQPMQAYSLAHPDSFWRDMSQLATAGMNVINIISSSKKAQKECMIEVVQENTTRLRDALAEFATIKKRLEQRFNGFDLPRSVLNTNPSAFYPIFDSTLEQFTGDQLVTICLEELEYEHLTPVMRTILADEQLWSRVKQALQSGAFNGRTDNFEQKQKRLYLLHQGVLIAQTEGERYKELYDFTVAKLFSAKAKAEQLTEEINRAKKQIDLLDKRIYDLDSHNKKMLLEQQDLSGAHARAQSQLDMQHQQLSTKNDEINKLTVTIAQQLNQLERLNTQLRAPNISLDQLQATHERVVQELNQQLEQLHHANQTRNQEVAALQQQLEQRAAANETLTQVLGRLRAEIQVQNQEMDNLRQQLAHSATVHKEPSLDTVINRTRQMAQVELAVRALEDKANALHVRKEQPAYVAAFNLAKDIRKEIAHYAQSNKAENEALVDFKKTIKTHITTAEQVLGLHRQKWKYVIANISLAVALVGVGYLIAALVNKGVNGNFTFFSKTNSKEHLDNLETVIANTKGIAG